MIVAAVNVLTQLMSLPAQPWWSIVMVALDVLIIYAVIVHGRETKAM